MRVWFLVLVRVFYKIRSCVDLVTFSSILLRFIDTVDPPCARVFVWEKKVESAPRSFSNDDSTFDERVRPDDTRDVTQPLYTVD